MEAQPKTPSACWYRSLCRICCGLACTLLRPFGDWACRDCPWRLQGRTPTPRDKATPRCYFKAAWFTSSIGCWWGS